MGTKCIFHNEQTNKSITVKLVVIYLFKLFHIILRLRKAFAEKKDTKENNTAACL